MAKQKSIKINAIYAFMRAFLKLVFPLLSFPYVSRILSPDGIGQINFANSIISYFNLFALLGIETYARREVARIKDDKIALSKFVKEILVINLISMLFAYILFFLAVFFLPILSPYKNLLYIICLEILFNVIGINWLFYGLEEFKYITIRSFIVQCISIVFLFIAVRSKEDILLYAIYGVIISTGYDVFNIFYSRRFIDYKLKTKLEFKKHFRYIFTFFGMTLITSVYEMLDTTMITILSNDTQTGYYTAGVKMNRIMLGLLTAMSGVLLPRLSYYKKNGEENKYSELKIKGIKIITLLAVPMVFGLIALSEPVILLMCSSSYIPSILIMQIISPIIFIMSMSNLAGAQILPSINKEKISLISYILGAIVNLCFNLFLIPKFGALGAAFGTVIAEFTVMIIQVIFLKEDFFRKDIIINLIQSLISAIIMFILIYFLMQYINNSILQLIISFIVGVCIYSLLLLFFRNKTFIEYCNLFFTKLFKHNR